MANIVHSHFVCLFKPFTFVSQFLLPKCKYRCSITKMNINIPRMQCKYIHVANGNPNRPLPPHASICMLDSNTNKAIGISKRLHNRSFFIFSIVSLSFPFYHNAILPAIPKSRVAVAIPKAWNTRLIVGNVITLVPFSNFEI